ncbi:MAG: sigma-54-dependent Fis family transcriptional regulator [Flavobacteriia bacterium]|jgi:DNA-binding NtrC family response regulator|nr:sigma-54-dependent Fis family transcriptional regulator [Flavobacteriia bacterium]NBV68198.1 sigma-54-dependent Fis family transcriptional regulator [Flavobacteriia bacterium]NBV91713.1 sigma-54-dependent Fis family transcriptional regulator [Flavobacteriia bacterium]
MRILITDDDRSIRRALRDVIELEGHQVEEAEDGLDALKKIEKTAFDVLFCDLKMPQMDGLALMQELQDKGNEVQIIVMSGHGTIETAVKALKLGAYDFIEKPLNLNRILVSLKHVSEKNQLVLSNVALRTTLKKIKGSSIVGNSKPILDIQAMVQKVAPSDARVLITGPNGSGKELVARSLHDLSNRAKGPFVEVNCAAIPSELIESELFGHEKGAFTSAVKDKKGKFELASGGTLFLDEIGDMSLSAQAKVLRALQENSIQRVGGEKDVKVDCRIIAATNKDLRKEISESRFREDLYHRLAVIPIHVPSLNDRIEDIPLLAEHFISIVCNEQGIPKKSIDPSGIAALQKVDWTGNIRELRNVLERLVILCDEEIKKADVERYANPK